MARDRETLVQQLGNAVQRDQASVDDFDREAARLLGVGESDLRCLEILLVETQKATPGLLAAKLGLTSGSITTMLDRLQAAGFVTRTSHPRDRRKTVVTATPAAQERAFALITPLVEDGTEQVLARYSAAQIALIIDFLTLDAELHERHIERLRAIESPAPTRGARPARSRPARPPAPSPRTRRTPAL